MNRHDLENVYFLLNADEKTVREWYANTTADDHEYACEIMKAYQEELFVKLELLKMENLVIDDIHLASNVLDKFRK